MRKTFTEYVQMREGLGFGLDPQADQAVTKILMKLQMHGAMPEDIERTVQWLQSPKGQKWVSGYAGPHTQQVLATVIKQLV